MQEPREPFLENESPMPDDRTLNPTIRSLKIPSTPLNKEKLAIFLAGLAGLVAEIKNLSRNDQHALAAKIHEVKEMVHHGDFSPEIKEVFNKIATHFNEWLTRSTPVDREEVLESIKEIKL